MTDYIAEANKATEQYLTALAKTQDEFVKAVEAFVKQIPALPESPVALPTPAVELPSAGEVTAVSFDFAEALLAQQRATTDKLIAVLTPAV
jgi:hypothetical protein